MRRQSSKSAETRERILTAALALFAERGFARTTMRDIAAKADCSLGLAYRYFKSKDSMVLAQYDRMVTDMEADVAALPTDPLAQRWGRAIRAHLAGLEADRGGLMGLASAGLTPGSATQVLGQDAGPLRNRMLNVFHEVVSKARDAPRYDIAEALPTLFYSLHLVLVLFWLQDSTPGQRTTHQLIDVGEEILGRMRLLLRLPWAAQALTKLSGILAPTLGGSSQETSEALAE